jgi:TatD DNase family protein
MHAWSGSAEQAAQFVRLGAHVSIAGAVTYAGARKAVLSAKAVPPWALLLESDAPYIAPEPHRGEPNEPPLLALTAERVARERGVAPGELAGLTRANAGRFFDE